jgi:hypothetical protein
LRVPFRVVFLAHRRGDLYLLRPTDKHAPQQASFNPGEGGLSRNLFPTTSKRSCMGASFSLSSRVRQWYSIVGSSDL